VPLILGVELLPVIVTESLVLRPCTAEVVTTVGAATVFPLIVNAGPEVVITVGLANVLLTTLKVTHGSDPRSKYLSIPTLAVCTSLRVATLVGVPVVI